MRDMFVYCHECVVDGSNKKAKTGHSKALKFSVQTLLSWIVCWWCDAIHMHMTSIQVKNTCSFVCNGKKLLHTKVFVRWDR
jgi:hypothetical protein